MGMSAAVGFSALPAGAGLVSGFSNPERTVLRANVTVLPDDPQDLGRVVLSVPVTLQAGQTRRISDQLTVTVTRDAEVENFVECLDSARGDPDIGVMLGGNLERTIRERTTPPPWACRVRIICR
jgi:hypothetical protein